MKYAIKCLYSTNQLDMPANTTTYINWNKTWYGWEAYISGDAGKTIGKFSDINLAYDKASQIIGRTVIYVVEEIVE